MPEVLSALGAHVDAYDILRSEDHDLLNPVLQEQLIQKLKAGEYDAIIMSPPCATWSRAPWANSFGPRPLRSSLHPMGFPWLEKEKRDKVMKSNGMVECTFPKPTRLLHNLPGLQAVLASGLPQLDSSATYVGPLAPDCNCGQVHIPLIRKSTTDTFATTAAAAYPPAMDAWLAHALFNHLLKRGRPPRLNTGHPSKSTTPVGAGAEERFTFTFGSSSRARSTRWASLWRSKR